jgi:hypothetical protein
MGAMSIDAPSPALDHLVLPTASLDAARRRLGALGFTVAPTGIHPFGTANCCVYMADGTFLEPLAVADPDACAAAAAAGNVFVARDRAFRAGGSEEGFSAIVLGTADAGADHRAYRDAGISAGDILTFSRPVKDAAGRSDTASFRLAFAAVAETVPFVFSCERVNAPAVDRSSLERHANGVARVLSVTIVAHDPAAAAEFVAKAAGRAIEAGAEAMRLSLSNADILIRQPRAAESVGGGAFDFRDVTFAVSSLSVLPSLLEANGVGFEASANHIIVPPAPGQGATFIFEERA